MSKRQRAERFFDRAETDSIVQKGHRAIEILAPLCSDNHPERNPMRQLQLYRKHTQHLLNWVLAILRVNNELRSMSLLETPNEHLAWAPEEDHALVEDRANGTPMHVIANNLGRTPAACATRLSTLTGIPRPDIVSAYIDGTLDSIPVRGVFHGRQAKLD